MLLIPEAEQVNNFKALSLYTLTEPKSISLLFVQQKQNSTKNNGAK